MEYSERRRYTQDLCGMALNTPKFTDASLRHQCRPQAGQMLITSDELYTGVDFATLTSNEPRSTLGWAETGSRRFFLCSSKMLYRVCGIRTTTK